MVFKKGSHPWNYGFKGIQEGEKNNFYGKHHTESSKQKHRQKSNGKHYSILTEFKKGHKVSWEGKRLWKNKKPPRLGEKQTEETKAKIRISRAKQIITAESNEKRRQYMLSHSNPAKRPEVRKKLSSLMLNRKGNYPNAFNKTTDLPVINELSRRGYAFYVQVPIEDITKPDILFLDKKIAIYCDGDHYHNFLNKIYLSPKGKKLNVVREKDERINTKLREQGWLVLRYWEHEIKANVEGCVDEIEDVLMNRSMQ